MAWHGGTEEDRGDAAFKTVFRLPLLDTAADFLAFVMHQLSVTLQGPSYLRGMGEEQSQFYVFMSSSFLDKTPMVIENGAFLVKRQTLCRIAAVASITRSSCQRCIRHRKHR